MRAMFDLGDKLLPYEKNLLGLFTKVISTEEMKENGLEVIMEIKRKYHLVKNYAALLINRVNTWEAVIYHDALN